MQLVVLESQLQRLGPSTPYRYTALPAPGAAPWSLQQPLLSPVSPVRSPTRWAADAGTQTLPDWLAVDAARMGEATCTSRHVYVCAAAEKSKGHQQHDSGAPLASPWRRKPRSCQQLRSSSPQGCVARQAHQGHSTHIHCVLADRPGVLTARTTQCPGECINLTKGNERASCVAAASHPAVSSKGVAAHSCTDWTACSPASKRKAAQIAQSTARRQVEVSARYAAIGRAAARENAALAAAAQKSHLEQLLQQQQQPEACCPYSVQCDAANLERPSTCRAPVHNGAQSGAIPKAATDNTLEALLMKHVWVPARDCSHGTRIQEAQIASSAHAASQATASSSRIMAGQLQTLSACHAGGLGPSTAAGRTSPCASCNRSGQHEQPSRSQQHTQQLEVSVAEAWRQLADATAAVESHKQLCAADPVDDHISAIKRLLGQWRLDQVSHCNDRRVTANVEQSSCMLTSRIAAAAIITL